MENTEPLIHLDEINQEIIKKGKPKKRIIIILCTIFIFITGAIVYSYITYQTAHKKEVTRLQRLYHEDSIRASLRNNK